MKATSYFTIKQHTTCTIAILLTLLYSCCACSSTESQQQQMTKNTVHTALLEALKKSGFVVQKENADNSIEIAVNGMSVTMHPDNLYKECIRDNSLQPIDNWIEAIVEGTTTPGSWEDSKPGILYSAVISDMNVPGVLKKRVTDRFDRALIWMLPSNNSFEWLNKSYLDKWNVDEKTVEETASRNMAVLLDKTPVKILQKGDSKLAVFDTDSKLKASFIFCPNFKTKMKETIGWPVYAIAPCSDFFMATTDKEIAARFGPTVIKEYNSSDNPVTSEVLFISDDGIKTEKLIQIPTPE
ncbi:MAG: hypothetical protein H6677_12920 [Candidatus Obscuribacterales bacterium]|nr:hypothetical protein [Candidatus Obscuribacterales bacterium]